MNLAELICQMPKVELHVHLEGAVRPATLLQLAAKNQVSLPATTEEELRHWYHFTDFSHFIEVYMGICNCICTPDDMETVARAFLQEQARQNIVYSEVIFTPHIHYATKGISFEDQLAALNRAIAWAQQELGIDMGIVVDISRNTTPEEGLLVADWAINAMGKGVIALGLGGPEVGHPPQKHRAAFERAHQAGLPALPHAGETEGPASIWGALDCLYPSRILHGVRCIEDVDLAQRLVREQIPLDVCPTSNICLNVFPSIEEHPLPHLLAMGINVTINSDDPPMFNTTLTDEYLTLDSVFNLPPEQIRALAMNAIDASLLPADSKANLYARFEHEFEQLFNQLEG